MKKIMIVLSIFLVGASVYERNWLALGGWFCVLLSDISAFISPRTFIIRIVRGEDASK